MKVARFIKKAMVISMEDQISYCNRTIQVGPHILVVTCATLDASVPRLRQKHREWTLKHGGHTIWRCTPSLCSYLVASKAAERRRVLELGAGMGVSGLIAHKTGAAVVVLTDGDSSAMKHLNQNISTNVGYAGEGKMDEAKIEAAEEEENRPAHARHLRWGDAKQVRELMEVLETGRFDLVLGADVIYPESAKKAEAKPLLDAKVRDLMKTAAAALREGGTFLLAHEIRDGDVQGVFEIMEMYAIASGFGPPRVVRMEDGPARVVLSLVFLGKTGNGSSSEKSDDADDAEQGWKDLITCLQAAGFGKI